MKERFIYELNIYFEDGTEANLLYSRLKDAINDKEHVYMPGAKNPNGIVQNSFVMRRILF